MKMRKRVWNEGEAFYGSSNREPLQATGKPFVVWADNAGEMVAFLTIIIVG